MLQLQKLLSKVKIIQLHPKKGNDRWLKMMNLRRMVKNPKKCWLMFELSKEDEVDGNASLDNGNEVDYFTVEEDG